MSHRELAQDIKTKNIIEMALAFTAMMRVFSERSNAAIGGRLAQLFARLDRIAETQRVFRPAVAANRNPTNGKNPGAATVGLKIRLD